LDGPCWVPAAAYSQWTFRFSSSSKFPGTGTPISARVCFSAVWAFFGLALLFWPLAAILRRHYGRTLDLTPGEWRARLRTRIVCLIEVVLLLAWIAYGSFAGKDFSLLSSFFDPWLRLMELAGVMVVFGTRIAIHNCLKAWGNPNRWFWSKPGETLIALASVGLTWFIFNWHMLALSLNY